MIFSLLKFFRFFTNFSFHIFGKNKNTENSLIVKYEKIPTEQVIWLHPTGCNQII